MSNHVVHTVSLVLPANDYQEAIKHQAAAKHWVQHVLSNLLNNYLDQQNRNDELVYIDKIEINIPDLPWNLPDATWQQTFASTIRLDYSASNTLDIILKQWVFYLQQGCFEKTAVLDNRKAIEKYLLSYASILTSKKLGSYIKEFSLPLLQRLFNQHGKELVTLVMGKLFALPLAREQETVYTAVSTQLEVEPDKTFIILTKILEAARQEANPEKAYLITMLLDTSQQPHINPLQDYSHPTSKDTLDNGRQPAIEVFINCPNAGIVLLFPYLQRFFENCQLLKGNEFISETARQIAIQTLHYLATGESLGIEEELVLPKLLCGLPLHEYIVFEKELPASIQIESNELLQAVVEHWQTLKNTSVEGLRTTFLQRLGRLVQKDDSYILQVEESGVDILLNSIPWGFRNYRLPWMSFNLLTEWY